jgi:hypothetical protein
MRSATPQPSGWRGLFRVIVPVVLMLFLGVVAWQGYLWLNRTPEQPPLTDEGDVAKGPEGGDALFGQGDVKTVPPLENGLLRGVLDSEPLPTPDLNVDVSKLPRDQQIRFERQMSEYEVFQHALVNAHLTDSSAFAAVARKDVTYAQLMTRPKSNRGTVVHVHGQLKRLRKNDAPFQVAQEDFRALQRRRMRAAADVMGGFLFSQTDFPWAPPEHLTEYYEGWVFDPNYGPNPMCLVFTDLPEGLPVAEDVQPPREVSFDGYFFKRYGYKSADTKPGEKGRDTVLLVGHSPVVLGGVPAAADSSPFGDWTSPLLAVFLALVVAAVGVVLVLQLWFRRTDSRVRERLAETTAAEFVPPAPPPVAEPVGGNGPGPDAGPDDLNFDDRGGPRR